MRSSRPTIDRQYIQVYCYVMSPHYQSEVVPLVIGLPTDMAAFCTAVQRALVSLRLRFVPEVVPTIPQISQEFASLLVVPPWRHAACKQVIVYDLRACGGPVYSGFVDDRVTFWECQVVARRHGLDACSIYAQGCTVPLRPGSSFLAITGGVVQFQPPNTEAARCSPLHSRLDRPNDWSSDPVLPDEEVEWPLFVSHHDNFSLFSADRFPDGTAASNIAGFVDRSPETALFVTSPGRLLEDIAVHGVACRDAMAVFPLTPSPDREGALIFLDLRQIDLAVTHMYLDQPVVAPSEIIQRLHLRAPTGFKVVCWPRPEQTGRISCVEGDIVLFGFVPDSWESSDECGSSSSEDLQSSDSEAPSGADSAEARTGGEAEASSGLSGTGGVAAPPSREGSRSRSPRRNRTRCLVAAGNEAALPCHSAGTFECVSSALCTSKAFCSLLTGGVLPIGAPVEAAVCKWAGRLMQDAIVPGNLSSTSADDASTFSLDTSGTMPREATTLSVAFEVDTPVEVGNSVLVVHCCGSLFARRQHKIAIEPTGSGSDDQGILDDLRSITLDLGFAWPYRAPFGLHVPGVLHDFEESDTSPSTEPGWVRVIVLKWMFSPERLMVSVRLPATPTEAVAAVQGARLRSYAHDFPHLIAAAPQPAERTCYFLANPAWYSFDLIACADMAEIDGRVFAIRLPDYVDKQAVLAHVDLSPGVEVTIYAGFLDAPLQDGIPLHLFPGITLRFLPGEQPPRSVQEISQLLQSGTIWDSAEEQEVDTPLGHYCLVSRHSSRLLHLDNLLPMQYRDRLAEAIGCAASEVTICPASPRASDIAIDGYCCHTAIVVVPTSFLVDSGDSFCLLIDCRSILQGWVCFKVASSRLPASAVLREFNEEAPLGMCATVDHVLSGEAFLDVQPGQVLTVRYVPLPEEDPTAVLDGYPPVEHAWGPSREDVDGSSDATDSHSASAAGADFKVLVPCMFFMQDYCPEVYEAAVNLPILPEEFLSIVLPLRPTERQEIAPRPCIVRP